MNSSQNWLPNAERHKSVLPQALRTQINVIHALILHDIKNRFFGNGLGYVVTILWPTVHVVIIVGIFVIGGRVAPFGNSTLLYAITGVVPYICWNYISRFMQMTVLQNRSFLSYPIINFIDMLIARVILEVNSMFIIITLCFIVLPIFGTSAMPMNAGGAAMAVLSAICLGIGFGTLATVITKIFPLFVLGYVVFLIVFWFTAGVAINPEAMPREIGDIIAWNPLLHSIEWLRQSYFIDAPTRLLSKTYVFEVSFVTFTLGLIGSVALKPFFKM